jgi:hypothetical protein
MPICVKAVPLDTYVSWVSSQFDAWPYSAEAPKAKAKVASYVCNVHTAFFTQIRCIWCAFSDPRCGLRRLLAALRAYAFYKRAVTCCL